MGGKIGVYCDCVVNNEELFGFKRGGIDNLVNFRR